MCISRVISYLFIYVYLILEFKVLGSKNLLLERVFYKMIILFKVFIDIIYVGSLVIVYRSYLVFG